MAIISEQIHCEFCGTLRFKQELYEKEICASSCNGYPCCYAYKCSDCRFECSNCQKVLDWGSAILINGNEGLPIEPRKFLCCDCYTQIPENMCTCGSTNPWKIIKDGKIKCPACDVIKKITKIQIWYGISNKEYERRYG